MGRTWPKSGSLGFATGFIYKRTHGNSVERLVAPLRGADLDALAGLWLDAVAGNASIGFPAGTTSDQARAFWKGIEAEMAAGRAVVLVARVDGVLAGTGQLRFSSFPNGRHRAEVAKLLVHSATRRRGLATSLMGGLEAAAREAGRSLLVLDTEEGSPAERMYERLGWAKAGGHPRLRISARR